MKVQYYGTGRRKTAVARVRLVPGEGKIIINGRAYKEYFGGSARLETVIKQPLIHTATLEKYNVVVRVEGGGVTSQAGAVRHGIARALLATDGELKPALRKGGFLTRDPRMHERKKYGQPGRRKRFQFSKR